MDDRPPRTHRGLTDVGRSAQVIHRDQPLFDLRPMQVGGFELRGRACLPKGRPTLEGWTQAMLWAVGAQDASPYWVGDLLAYGEAREDWRDRYDQALAQTGFSKQTLYNQHYIATHVAEPERLLAPTIGHADVVAKLPAKEQAVLLEEATEHGWGVHEFRRAVRAKNRRKIIEGQAILQGQYRVLYADCPWLYGNRPPSGSGAKDHYPAMTIEQLMAMPIAKHARPDAVLLMWTTSPLLLQRPGPSDVIDAWGFTYKASRIWDKVEHGFGNYWSIRHEILLLATKGSCLPDRPTPMQDSVVTERQQGAHSSKPHSFRQDIEKLYDGPYLELFASERHEGWDAYGNDARLAEAIA